jgi:hypothetical protein
VTQAGRSYYQPTPLDFLILEALPEKGVLGGVHWAGRPVKHVREQINEGLPEGAEALGVNPIQARMRSMKVEGLVEDFASHGSGRIWARTVAGSDFLVRKDEVLGS